MITLEKTIVTIHVFRRMNLRNISIDMALQVINFGEIIKEYPDDRPYPSKLSLGYVVEKNQITLSNLHKPLHVVYSISDDDICYLITAYWPDTDYGMKILKRKLSKMICPTCKTGTLQPGFTFYTQMLNNKMIVIKNVPALICDNCGEEVLQGTDAKKIEEHLKELKSHNSELEIVSYKGV